MNTTDVPLDPNQVFCRCGRLIRVVPALQSAGCVMSDCAFVSDEKCPRCRSLAHEADLTEH